jgi:hypothetical protein
MESFDTMEELKTLTQNEKEIMIKAVILQNQPKKVNSKIRFFGVLL